MCYEAYSEKLVHTKVNIPGTNFTEPTDWSSMLMAPDREFDVGI
jgi:hypothetical protein